MTNGTDELIARLSGDLKPVKRVWSPARRLAIWTGAAVIYVLAMIAIAGTAGVASGTRVVIGQQLIAGLLAMSAAFGALLTVQPGRPPQATLLTTGVVTCAWFLFLAGASLVEYRARGVVGFARETDWPCVASILIGGSVLTGVMVAMLKRGAPLAPRRSVALAAVAAAAVASVEACVSRPHVFIGTILIWHGVAASLLVLALAANAHRLLSWRGASRKFL